MADLDVNSVAPSTTAADGLDDLFTSDSGNDSGVKIESPTIGEDTTQDPTTSNITAKPAVKNMAVDLESLSDDEKSSLLEKLSPRFKERVDKLSTTVRAAEDRARKIEMEKDRELSKYKEAYQFLNQQYNAKQKRLQEIDDIDPVQAENEQLKLQQQVRDIQSRLQSDYQKKVAQVQQQANVAARAGEIVEQVEAAAAKYPTVSKEEIAFMYSRDMTKNPETIAQSLHNARYSKLEQEILGKYKDRLNPPKPVGATNVVAAPKIKNDRDLIDSLDAEFGADWNRRK